MVDVQKEIRITGFGGSFRKGSYKGMLLREAQRLMPDSSILEIADISGIPLYNQDLESQLPTTEVVSLSREGHRKS
ncbi:MAG: NADPH-dependent FMN reductase [Thermoplasmataceae archaeon]